MRTIKQVLCTLLLLLMILALVGCDSAPETPAPTTPAPTTPAPTTEPEPQVYTFTYDFMGGTYNGEAVWQVEVQENETAANITPTKEGCLFAGWTTDIAASDAPAYSFDQPVAQDTVIYAVWEGPQLRLHTDGGSFPLTPSGSPADYSFYPNHEDFILPTPEKAGFVFAGWFDSSLFSGQPVAYIPQGSTEPYTLYAKWVAKGTSLPIVYADHCVRNADGTTSAMPDQKAVYTAFFSDFYYFIVEDKDAEAGMQSNAAKQGLKIESVEDFLAIGSDYDAGIGDMFALAYIASGWFMEAEPGGHLEIQSGWHFIGHCYRTGEHVELIHHLAKFFAYWRYDEGFTTPTNHGSDFYADPWASLVDICKFFYFDKDTSYVKTDRVLRCYDNIPGVFYPEKLELVTQHTVGEATQLTRPTFEGYTFVGWYRELNGQPVESISPEETEPVQLIGVWEKNE